MSELIANSGSAGSYRKSLLEKASMLMLITALSASQAANADDGGRPTVWIDLGGQFEDIKSDEGFLAPPFLSLFEPLGFSSVLPVQSTSRRAFGEEGNVSFQPRGSDWMFTASIRYGRSSGRKTLSQQLSYYTQFGSGHRYLNITASSKNSDVYSVMDFQAGKDVGLGLFGKRSGSLIRLGIRFAQFTSQRKANQDGVPDYYHITTPNPVVGFQKYRLWTHHRYYASSDIKHSFSGIGPSLSWDASSPIVGRPDDSSITLDWGVNAAVLFGRQKATGQNNITGLHYHNYQRFGPLGTFHGADSVASYHDHHPVGRSRSVVVPNIGGFAGFSFRYSNAKVSFGYRADAFFGAMDTGIDTRHDANTLFYGPFATVSLGLGG